MMMRRLSWSLFALLLIFFFNTIILNVVVGSPVSFPRQFASKCRVVPYGNGWLLKEEDEDDRILTNKNYCPPQRHHNMPSQNRVIPAGDASSRTLIQTASKPSASSQRYQSRYPHSSYPLRIIIAGPPAAGKGTQCESIVRDFGLVHLSTGEILRTAVRDGTPLGMEAKPYMDSGHLVPDSLVIQLVLDRISQADCLTKGWLLDGFPRTKSQADALMDANIVPDVFLMLEVDESILVERVTGRRTDPVTGKVYHLKFNPPEKEEIAQRLVQRTDDTEEKIRVRFKEFQSHIDQVEAHYLDRMVTIDGGAGGPKEVSARVSNILKEVMRGKETQRLRDLDYLRQQDKTAAAAVVVEEPSRTALTSKAVPQRQEPVLSRL